MMRLRLWRRALVCQQAVELVTDYLEGALSRSDRRRYEAYLSGCPHCTEYLAQMRKTIELTGTLTPDDLTPQMQDDLIALYRQWRGRHRGAVIRGLTRMAGYSVARITSDALTTAMTSLPSVRPSWRTASTVMEATRRTPPA